MDPLRVKLWGPKHLGPSYICELSLHQKFQSPSITPSIKLFMALQNNNNNNNEKVTENSGNFVPPLLRKGDQSLTLHLRLRVSNDARANIWNLLSYQWGEKSMINSRWHLL